MKIEDLIQEIVDELKREMETKKPQEYKNGIQAALLIIFSTIKNMEEKQND
jgi:hypothetical protein